MTAIQELEEWGANTNLIGATTPDGIFPARPEFVTVQPGGAITTPKFDPPPEPWAKSFALGPLDIRVYCDTAVVIGSAEAEPANAPEGAAPLKFRFLHVWTKTSEGWRYTAQQWTQLIEQS